MEPSVSCGDDMIGVGFPDEGFWVCVIVFADKAVDGGLKVDDGLEDATLEPAPREFGEEAPCIGPSRSIGAARPERRKPAVNVVVFQWPWGMAARHRSPLRDHPRSRAIFIDAPVSSMKISRSGASPAWSSNQSRRHASTSGRRCSAAWPAFFLGDYIHD